MATNEILPFAQGGGANVQSQVDYAAEPLRSSGNVAGIARSSVNNKALRQASVIAAGIAQYMADNQPSNITDSLTPSQISAIMANATAGRLIGVQVFSTAGASVYTPTPGTKSVVVEAVGGGAAGGGAAATATGTWAVGGGGGAGAFAISRFTSGFAGVTVTIGAGGTPASAAKGGNGGTTSFGALMSCPGGLGGFEGPSISTPAIQAAGGFGGAAPSGGNIITARGDHGRQGLGVSTANWIAGAGGSNYGGGGIPHAAPASGAGTAGVAPGSGGAGAASFGGGGTQAGGAGVSGIVIVYEYA